MPPNDSSISCVICSDTRLTWFQWGIARPRPSLETLYENQTQKWDGDECMYTHRENNRECTGCYAETLNEKNHGSPQTPNYQYKRGIQNGSTKATTSCTQSSPSSSYNRKVLVVAFRCVCVCLWQFSTTVTTSMHHNNSGFPRSYLYSHDLRKIYKYSLKGLT